MLARWWGQLCAIWDNAGQMVDLREEIMACQARIDELFDTINTVNERTRKQDYRARKADEHAYFAPPATAAIPQGGKAELIKRAKALGIM